MEAVLNTVRLQQAFWFRCLACDCRNFEALEEVDLTDEQHEEAARELLGLMEWESIPTDFVADAIYCPTKVVCQYCQHVFLVDAGHIGLDADDQEQFDNDDK